MQSSPRITQPAVRDAFVAYFKTEPEFIVRTPGRVNLIGEHTDYNGGFVFPMTIDRAIWLAVRKRDDGLVRVYSLDYKEERCLASAETLQKESRDASIHDASIYDAPIKDASIKISHKDRGFWFEYVKGCAWVLQRENLPLTGFDALLTGDVPSGAGLSSSAALEISILLTFAELGGYILSKIETAKLGQRAENQWVGVQCGIMDQTICALGQEDKALLLDCRSLDYRVYDLPPGTVVALLDTATRHSLAASAYNERREECEAACKVLGVSLLRDATQEGVDAHKKEMPEAVYRRARHIVAENLRTRAAAVALKNHDAHLFGRLMNESHFSLQYDFEVSCFELDAITTIARGHPACLGARMTGGGFGGSAVALLYSMSLDGFAAYVSERYREQTGKEPHITLCRATDGGRVEWL